MSDQGRIYSARGSNTDVTVVGPNFRDSSRTDVESVKTAFSINSNASGSRIISQTADVIIIKGDGDGDYQINLTDIRQHLNVFYQHRLVIFRNLPPTVSASFKSMLDVIKVMTTTNTISQLREMIKDVFKEEDNYVEGTLGAFFAGCMIRTNFPGNPSCSSVCSGSLSHVDDEGWKECGEAVIHYDGTRFALLNNPHDKSKCHLHIPEALDFKGFSQNEINNLTTYGVRQIKVYKVSACGKHYIEVNSEFADLGGYLCAGSNSGAALTNTGGPNQGGLSTGAKWAWAIVIIILILILLWFLFCHCKKKDGGWGSPMGAGMTHY